MAFPPTFADITQTVIDLVRLDVSADTTKVQDAINTAYYEATVENEVLVSSGTATLTAGSATYDLDSAAQIARIKDLWIEGSTFPLRQVSLDRILRLRLMSPATEDTGARTLYSLSGQNQLDLWPTPGSAATIVFVYVGFPDPLAGSDVPVIPEPYGSNILTYGACVPMAEFKSDPQLSYFSQQSESWLRKYRGHLNRRRGLPGSFEIAGESPVVPHDRALIL